MWRCHARDTLELSFDSRWYSPGVVVVEVQVGMFHYVRWIGREIVIVPGRRRRP